MNEERICYNCQYCFENPIGDYYCEMWLKFTGGHKTCKRFSPYPAIQLCKTKNELLTTL